MMTTCDVAVIGSGVAGLSLANYLKEEEIRTQQALDVAIFSKGSFSDTNTRWAQGGIAAVSNLADSFEHHIADTMEAGAHCNNVDVVKKVIREGPAIMNDLLRWKVNFDKRPDHTYDLAKEGGHSHARIWHHQDITGHAMQAALLHKAQAGFQTFHSHVHLIQAEKTSNGFILTFWNQKVNQPLNVACKILVLATGGLGALYARTTNPAVATGDGILIAHQLGAKIQDLCYIQFHPTGLYDHHSISLLISEALRGAGAVLRNKQGELFMERYDARGSLAPRDIVSRAILSEMEISKSPHVYLDATQVEVSVLQNHFPHLLAACQERANVDMTLQYIPVVPVQHYSCGGVAVDEFGESHVPQLYAIGEVASTGLHGANRLASNSLLEAVAFAKFASTKIANQVHSTSKISNENATATTRLKIKKLDRALLQNTMSRYAGIRKTRQGLSEATHLLASAWEAAEETEAFSLSHFETQTLYQVAFLLLNDAQSKTENKGVHYVEQ